jgi:hypothetical protein
MNPHPAEVVAEARLHEGASFSVERLAGRAQDFVDDRKSFGRMSSLAL